MLKLLFKNSLCKHLDAPLLKERESYLSFLNSTGICRNSLILVADYMLRIIELMDLFCPPLKPLKVDEIVTSAEGWSNRDIPNLPSRKEKLPSKRSRSRFINYALKWFLYLGWLEILPTDRISFAPDNHYNPRVPVRKHETAPLLEERESFLSYKIRLGTSTNTLNFIRAVLPHIIEFLQFHKVRIVTEPEIQTAATHWGYIAGKMYLMKDYSKAAEKRFIRYATQWMEFLGCLKKETNTIPFAAYLNEYFCWLDEERGCAKSTIEGLGRVLPKLLRNIQESCGEFHLLSLATADAIIKKRHEDGLSRRGMAYILSTYRAFLKYAESKGWCTEGIHLAFKSPRLFKHEELPSFTTWDTISAILEKKDTDHPTDIRDYAIILLLTVYSLRGSEVANLKLKDIDWRKKEIQIQHTKNGYPRTYPLINSVGDAIIRYLKKVRNNNIERDFVFIGMHAPYRKLSRDAIYMRVSKALKAQGVTLRHYGPHSLRHTGATHLLNSGYSMKQIADHLGHRLLDTTRIYAKVDLVNLRKVAKMEWEGLI
jgi:site-specific recombinase XerD